MSSGDTYKIKKGDTVKSIAKELYLDVEELKNYHNNECNPCNKLPYLGIPKHIKEIITPQKRPFIGRILCSFFEEKISYGVLKFIKNGEKENTIKYEVNISFSSEEESGEDYVSVDLISKIYINDREPNLMIDELAVMCTEILYPVVFKVDKSVRLLEIKNHQEIIDRWKRHKEKKLTYFQGEVANKYINSFEKTLFNEDFFLSSLKNDWLFHLYFNNIYTTYLGCDQEEKETINFSIIPNTKAVEFKIKKNANTCLKSNNLEINIKGICSDKRNINELENKLYFPEFIKTESPITAGNYNANYSLKHNTKRIESAFLQSDLELSENKYVLVSISEIETKNNKETKEDQKNNEKQKINKEPFWRSLFS